MKKILLFVFYTLFLIMLGRQLEFLPALKAPSVITKNSLSADELRDDIKLLTSEYEGDYSIYYEDLKTGEAFGLDHNTILTAASINKIPVVFYLYSLASKREIDLEEKITLLADDIQDYGTGKLRYEEPGGVYTLKKLAELAFQHSDNTAIHLLTIRLGEDKIQSFVDENEMAATNIAFNETSPKDVGNLFNKFYNNELMTEALKKELMDYMSNTEFEDRLPRFIKDLPVYHKIGDADNMVHDAGIIEAKESPFILVVMTQGIVDENKARENIGLIAKEIYEKR